MAASVDCHIGSFGATKPTSGILSSDASRTSEP